MNLQEIIKDVRFKKVTDVIENDPKVMALLEFAFQAGVESEREQPAQQSAERGEPVAWCDLNSDGSIAYFDNRACVMPGAVGNESHPYPLYTTPPAQPAREPLTDEQIREIWVEHGCEGEDAEGFARAIEAAHGVTSK